MASETQPTPTSNTKYADFITQAQEGITQAIKMRSKAGKSESEHPLVRMLRQLMEDDDDKDNTNNPPTD